MKITFQRLVPAVLLIINIIIAAVQSNIHSFVGWLGMLVMLIFIHSLDGLEG